MNTDEIRMLARICKMYYILEMKQEDIAKKENLSKSSVSRLINKARDLGYIKVSLDFPKMTMIDIELQLQEAFNLEYVSICETYSLDDRLMFVDISRDISNYLNMNLDNGSTLGVSWGRTLRYVSENLDQIQKKDIEIVQLNGGISHIASERMSENILLNIAKKLDGDAYALNVPSFMENKEIVDALKQDSRISMLLEKGKNADIALFGIGNVEEDSVLIQSGYFTKQQYHNEVVEPGYVGDICSRFILSDGSFRDNDLYNKVVGINLCELSHIKHRMGVATGVVKAKAVLASLRGGYVTALFTDEETALEVLRLHNQ